MTDMASTGNPNRLQSQLNQLKQQYPNSQISGKVLYENSNISTSGIKAVETKYIQEYYDIYGVEPVGNPNHPGLNR